MVLQSSPTLRYVHVEKTGRARSHDPLDGHAWTYVYRKGIDTCRDTLLPILDINGLRAFGSPFTQAPTQQTKHEHATPHVSHLVSPLWAELGGFDPEFDDPVHAGHFHPPWCQLLYSSLPLPFELWYGDQILPLLSPRNFRHLALGLVGENGLLRSILPGAWRDNLYGATQPSIPDACYRSLNWGNTGVRGVNDMCRYST